MSARTPKVVLVSRTWAAAHRDETAVLETKLGFVDKRIRIRLSTILPDILVPGMATLAFCVRAESSLVFSRERSALVSTLRKVKANFRTAFLVVIADTVHGIKLSRLITGQVSIPVLFCNSALDFVGSILRIFMRLYTASREARQNEQLRIMLELLLSKASVHRILQQVPWLSGDDAAILQDVYGTLGRVAAASESDILTRTPLSSRVAKAVSSFFAAKI